ncbi:MAG: transcriptional regulator, MarR family-like protein [Ramlibacter sp.]|nr:transcriptional regulator, MarR family-like protein [Ramlibacter sp.]
MPQLRQPRPLNAAAGSAGETPSVDVIDSSYLESLLGYNARRATLTVIEVFLETMAPYQLRPVDFSVLSLIAHNPGITSRQLCTTLGILPPNLVGMVNTLEKRELISRQPHPRDGRATGLHLTQSGEKLMRDAEATAAELEAGVAARLSPSELRTLIRLLKKIYQPA